ncbi:unnamed protein product [Staurois parvus]|uniref:Uncharacterized protein n=1 Tax=Staurois parvus TaxID=386267 RepID=A0ABN9G5W6_9NEOB|nr:unnamed protein product [Staurois parvus]
MGRRRWPGMLQGTHRGSEGQGKCCRDPLSNAHGKPECSSGLPLLVLKFYPELHTGKPLRRLTRG